ncbi:protein transport protein Yif1 [Hamiltosporidium tvaerminnensis]|uniref:Protein YIF1 n=1 Tax=Hamiltosporidium tvaerminnensis TaxID=1176355 RepID=A0A4Q9LS37_9MICR|nr:protein transport protein Yif1 [Hamiltosporidium tvaerminnensis]TBU11990.1 protein transport protein Yif1 [Hamiltosporidium tvaerminnensis]
MNNNDPSVLYANLLKIISKFKSQNFREYFSRKANEDFEFLQSELEKGKNTCAIKKYMEEQNNLMDVLKRQTKIYNLYNDKDSNFPFLMNVEMGKDVVKDYVNKGMQRVNFAKVRPYFNITNKYVLMKLIVIIFPFKNKEWHCAHHSDVIMADSMKVSDPDLYIPIMSFVTYILLIGLNMGFKNNFNPERLGIIFSRCLILELVCMSIVKLVGYFMDISELGLLDFLSFSGYKFVVIILNLLFKMKYLGVLNYNLDKMPKSDENVFRDVLMNQKGKQDDKMIEIKTLTKCKKYVRLRRIFLVNNNEFE